MTKTTSTLIYVTSAREGDLPKVAKIDAECFQKRLGLKRMRKLLLSETLEYVCYVARVAPSGKIIGFIFAMTEGNAVEILRVGVVPMYRRMQAGRRLVVQLLDEKPDDITLAIAHVHEDDSDSQMFFKGIDFPQTKLVRSHYDDKRDGYKFIKDL